MIYGIPEGPGTSWAQLLGQFSRARSLGRPQGAEGLPVDILPGFNERLMAWLPTMIEHRCWVGERGGFFERLRRGTYQGHILEHVTLELQTLAGVPTGFGRARETSEEGVYKVVDRISGRRALPGLPGNGRRLLDAAVRDLPFDMHGRSGQATRAGPAGLPRPQHRRRSSRRRQAWTFPSAG